MPSLVAAPETFRGSAAAPDEAARASAVSLLAEFGTEAAWGDPLGCIERTTTAWLRKGETRP